MVPENKAKLEWQGCNGMKPKKLCQGIMFENLLQTILKKLYMCNTDLKQRADDIESIERSNTPPQAYRKLLYTHILGLIMERGGFFSSTADSEVRR